MFSRIIKNKNKPTKYTFLFAAAVFILVTGLGYFKSSFIDDDIHIEGPELTEKDITGTWLEPVPGIEESSGSNKAFSVQGFTLYEDGSAESVNMHTLLVLKWRIEDSYLILTEKSIGNGTSSTGDEKYRIIKLGKNILQLGRGNSVFEYTRRNEADTE